MVKTGEAYDAIEETGAHGGRTTAQHADQHGERTDGKCEQSAQAEVRLDGRRGSQMRIKDHRLFLCSAVPVPIPTPIPTPSARTPLGWLDSEALQVDRRISDHSIYKHLSPSPTHQFFANF